jgi:hypothetical protein
MVKPNRCSVSIFAVRASVGIIASASIRQDCAARFVAETKRPDAIDPATAASYLHFGQVALDFTTLHLEIRRLGLCAI